MPNNDSFRDRHALITGGAGFIGSTLARRLVDFGAKVTVVDSLIPEYGGNLFNLHDLQDKVRMNISDVRDPHSMKFIVQGVPGLYRRINGPGEDFETVNTIGRPIYSNLVRDAKRNQWVQPEIYSYPLHMVTRPEVLLRGKNT